MPLFQLTLPRFALDAMSKQPAVASSTGARRLPVPTLSNGRHGTGADPAGKASRQARLVRRTTRGRLT